MPVYASTTTAPSFRTSTPSMFAAVKQGASYAACTLYTWNLVSPRLGVTTKLTNDGRTVLRASYGRFHQGILTAEISPIHPGVSPITTMEFDPATGGYTRLVSVVDIHNLQVDRGIR